ncbi:MAG: hypothetical protein K2K83_00380, partial [Rikenella sp.]|nr:hypothetical protein [Rikenella sp.]
PCQTRSGRAAAGAPAGRAMLRIAISVSNKPPAKTRQKMLRIATTSEATNKAPKKQQYRLRSTITVPVRSPVTGF